MSTPAARSPRRLLADLVRRAGQTGVARIGDVAAHASATAAGEFMGMRATVQKIRFDVHERARIVDGKLAERWARVDFEDIERQLTSPPAAH
jgi:predicted ester cyclase